MNLGGCALGSVKCDVNDRVLPMYSMWTFKEIFFFLQRNIVEQYSRQFKKLKPRPYFQLYIVRKKKNCEPANNMH